MGIFRIEASRPKGWLPGKEIIYFVLRPVAPPERQGL